MTEILLVRHGESIANKENLFAGHWNIDMTELGYKQAAKTAEYITENYKVEKVYSSDLKRAYETGKAISDRLGIDITTSKRLREIDAGKWDEMLFTDLPRVYPKEFETWMHDMGKSQLPSGESVAELGARMMSVLNEIADKNDGKTVAAATHATPIRAVIALIRGDINGITNVKWVSNASVTVIRKDSGKWSVVSIGKDEHLAELITYLPGIV